MKWQNLIEVIQQQSDLITRQSGTIIQLATRNEEQEQIINELMRKG